MSTDGSAVGAMLVIPDLAIQNIEKAERAIQQLERTSKSAANTIKGHWDNTAVSGLNAFIQKVQDANSKLGGIKGASVDMSGVGKGAENAVAQISALAQQVVTLGKELSEFKKSTQTSTTSTSSESEKITAGQINQLYTERIRIMKQLEDIWTRGQILQAQGKTLTEQETALISQLRGRYQSLSFEIDKIGNKKDLSFKQSDAILKGEIATTTAAIRVVEKRNADILKAEQQATKQQAQEIKARQDIISKYLQERAIRPENALYSAKNATTLSQLQDAYKNLRTAMASTDPNSAKWRELNATYQKTKEQIDKIRTSMGELNNQSKQTSGIVSQLKGPLAAAFSISSISGYIQKMVEVRAEFELQNVALRAILQNKDEADRIFKQVQNMALQSPFTIMQLTTYTKQLAAYRIEADKLIGTTKMLADVSAGLGVDIQRLILAYGQVKAANYLRATEIRQFTEAGLNIAGELANYFSELQGKMVSVGDVMDMVTKRMVRFEDVEEIFKRVTSAGGLFYDMQQKQSETVSGQIQRISDAYSIMLNEIGMSNQGPITTALSVVRGLISAWRDVWKWIKTAASGVTTYILAMKLLRVMGVTTMAELGTGFKLLGIQIKNAISFTRLLSGAIKGLMSSTGIGIIVAALGTLIHYLYESATATSELQEELDRIGSESVNDLNESIAKFIELTNVLKDTNKTFTEHEEALSELKRTYSEIIPAHMLESEYIQKLNGDYAELTNTIKQYYITKEYEKKKEALISGDDFKELTSEFQEAGEDMLKNGLFAPYITKQYVKSFQEQIAKEIATGELENTAEAIGQRMKNYFGEGFKGNDSDIAKYFEDAIVKGDEFVEKLDDIALSTTNAATYMESYEQSLKNMSTKSIENSLTQIEAAKKGMAFLTNRVNNASYYTDEQKTAITARYTESLKQWTEQEKLLQAALNERTAIDITKKVEEGVEPVKKQITAYYNLNKEYQSKLAYGRLTIAQEEEYKKKLDACEESAIKLADTLGYELKSGTLAAMDSEYSLKVQINDIAQKAFPNLAKKAISAKNRLVIAALESANGFLKLQQIINDMTSEFGFTIFDDQSENIKKYNEQIQALKEGTADTYNTVTEAEEQAQKKRNAIAEKYGVSPSTLDIPAAADESPRTQAENIRKQAKESLKVVEEYNKAVAKSKGNLTEKINGYSEQEIKQLQKEAKAQLEYADAIYYTGEQENKSSSRSRRGEDPIKKLWEDRIDAIKRYYDAAKKAREQMSEPETKIEQESAFKDLFSSLGLNNIPELSLNNLLMKGFDPKKLKDDYVGALKQLLSLIPTKYKEIQGKIRDMIASESIEIKFKIKEAERQTLQNEIDDMFANLELSNEIANMGVSLEFTYLFGGKPTTIEDIRRDYNRLMVDIESKSEKEQEIIRKMGESLDKKELELQKKRFQNYNKYLLESTSERVQIELKAQQAISKIRNDATLDQFSKEQAIANKRKQMQADLDKQSWSDFQSSDIYIDLFRDLETASTSSIKFVLARLNELKSSLSHLPADQVRAIVKQMEQLEKILTTRNPFSGFGSDLKESIAFLKKRNDIEKKYQASLTAEKGLKEQRDAQQKLFVDAQKTYDVYKAQYGESSLITFFAKLAADAEKDKLTTILDELEAQGLITKQLREQLEAGNATVDRTAGRFGEFSAATTQLSGSITGIADNIEQIFGTMGDGMRDAFDVMATVLGGMGEIESGISSILSGKIFSGTISVVSGLFNTVAGFFSIGDKKKERQIKKLQEKVEGLDKAYGKLHDSIEDAYKFDDYNAGYNQMMKNLEEQKRSYQEMIRLEEAKKKTDNDRIKEYQEKLEELAETEAEIRKERIEAQGSTTDWLGEAENFVDAWLDAYREVGDGTDALKENWDEFIDSLVVKQAAAAVVSSRIKSIIDKINNAIDEDKTGLDLSNIVKNATAEFKDKAGAMNQALKEFFDAFGVDLGGGEFVLSDLQKGIQNITEPQAAAIEAYLNSIRFAVYRHTEQLDALIVSISAQYNSTDNPILTEIKGIRAVLDSIDNRLKSVITTSVGKSYINIK